MVYFNLTFEYILFGCFCFSIPLYLWVLITIARVPKSDTVLCSPFFKIVLSTGIANIITAFHTYFYFKIRLWGWAFNFYSVIHAVFKYELLLGYATTSAQSIGTILIASNRFTAMATPLRHNEIWSTNRLRWYLFAQWVIPLLLSVPGAFLQLSDITFILLPDNGIINGTNYIDLVTTPVFTSRSSDLSRMTSTVYQLMSIAVWIISSLFVLVIYVGLFFELRRQRILQVQTGFTSTARASALEFRLLAYGLILVLIQGATVIFEILMLVEGFNKWNCESAVSLDFANYGHPYFLLALSAPLRQRCFSCMKKGNVYAINIQQSEIIATQPRGFLTRRFLAETDAEL